MTRCEKSGGTVIHFESMKNAIRNDTNCDWIVFDDGSVLVCEYSN